MVGLIVGSAVGFTDESLVGGAVGIVEGAVDGNIEGFREGAKVGCTVGEMDRVVVGFLVGELNDGLIVGVFIGLLVVGVDVDGITLGVQDGSTDGFIEGSIDGFVDNEFGELDRVRVTVGAVVLLVLRGANIDGGADGTVVLCIVGVLAVATEGITDGRFEGEAVVEGMTVDDSEGTIEF